MNTYCPACVVPNRIGTIGHSGQPKYCEKHLLELPMQHFTTNAYSPIYYSYTETTYEPKQKKRIWRARQR